MDHDQALQRRLSRWVHFSLLTGLIASGLLLVSGSVIVVKNQESLPIASPSLRSLVSSAASGNGVAILNLGLVLLMFTPVVRVAVLIVGWLAGREWLFAGIALVVFALLATSVILGTG